MIIKDREHNEVFILEEYVDNHVKLIDFKDENYQVKLKVIAQFMS